MSIVEINRVFKAYDGEPVVCGIDLRIEDGEFLVIVGPSGCGKTSVLRMVAGLEPISGGEILVDGEPVVDTHRRRRKVSMMFQDATLYPHMTVRENLAYPLKMAGVDRRTIKRDVAATAAMLGIGSLLSRRPGILSGGQRQRVAMGRALIRRPELLLMDEPMSHVDAKLRGELRATIGHLHQRFEVTTLYVTHDQVEAMSLGDRIAVMRHGRIVQCGTPDEVYRRPVDAFVATFIGQPAMNLFVGTVVVGSGGARLTVGDAALPLGDALDAVVRSGVDRDVVVGIRPHSLRFSDAGLVVDVERIDTHEPRSEARAALNARGVTVTSSGVMIGSRLTQVTVDQPADDAVDLRLWQPSHLCVEPDDIHLFDIETGRSLLAQPAVLGAA